MQREQKRALIIVAIACLLWGGLVGGLIERALTARRNRLPTLPYSETRVSLSRGSWTETIVRDRAGNVYRIVPVDGWDHAIYAITKAGE